MQVATRNKISELQGIISRMPLEVFCMNALPEFGVRWRELAKAVRNSRLPMQPSSVARVLCKHISQALTVDEVDDILARLRLKLAATQARTWHVMRLTEKITDEAVTVTIKMLPGRVADVLRRNKSGLRSEVQTLLLGDLLYLSVHLKSENKDGSTLYIATPPGHPVLLASSPNMKGLLRACAEGLGYKKFENANLFGRDITSLLRINDRAWNANTDILTDIPEYSPTPIITNTGIDYTNKKYNEDYVNSILGANPPVITDLNIKTNRLFFDTSRLNKNINLSINLKSQDVAKTLKCWVTKGALAPTSDFFSIFHKLKSNRINYKRDDSE